METPMSQDPNYNPFIDALAELVGQDKADRAIELADRARAHVAALLREATEVVDPAPDQREALATAEARIAELEAAVDEATEALARRASEVAQLNGVIDGLRADLTATTAQVVDQAVSNVKPAPKGTGAAPKSA